MVSNPRHNVASPILYDGPKKSKPLDTLNRNHNPVGGVNIDAASCREAAIDRTSLIICALNVRQTAWASRELMSSPAVFAVDTVAGNQATRVHWRTLLLCNGLGVEMLERRERRQRREAGRPRNTELERSAQ